MFNCIKDDFTNCKIRTITYILVLALLNVAIMLVPSILTMELGIYFADMSKTVRGVDIYLKATEANIQQVVNKTMVILMLIGCVVVSIKNVMFVSSQKKEYIFKLNLGMGRSSVIAELLFKVLLYSIFAFGLTLCISIFSCMVITKLIETVINLSLMHFVIAFFVQLVVALISCYVSFLFTIDSAKEA